jgi:preprotein translocase subunit SecB
LDYEGELKADNKIEAKVKMLGNFEYAEDSSLSVEDFSKINAPAILFPFVREHLASVSMKAGISPILLPPVNFVKLAEKKS